jgi:hypothetical protein
MSKEEAEEYIKNRRGFSDAPGGNAGAFLSVILVVPLILFIGIFIYVVLGAIFGWL